MSAKIHRKLSKIFAKCANELNVSQVSDDSSRSWRSLLQIKMPQMFPMILDETGQRFLQLCFSKKRVLQYNYSDFIVKGKYAPSSHASVIRRKYFFIVQQEQIKYQDSVEDTLECILRGRMISKKYMKLWKYHLFLETMFFSNQIVSIEVFS